MVGLVLKIMLERETKPSYKKAKTQVRKHMYFQAAAAAKSL